MKKLFVETRYPGSLELPKTLIEELPSPVMLAAPLQFVGYLDEIKKKLLAYKKEVYLFNSLHGRYPGQLLGCDNFKVGTYYPAECFLYIGDGEFHPKALLANEKPVFCYNPFTREVKKLGKKDWEELKLRKKVALARFYSADKIGIIISVKEGQKSPPAPIERLKEKLEKENKEVYLFLADEIKKDDLENFNFISCWVNTACPRLSDDIQGLVNLSDLAEK